MSTGVLMSLIPLVMWGIGDYIASKSAKTVHGVALSFYMGIVGFVGFFAVAPFIGLPVLYLEQFLICVVSAICVNAGFLFMLRGFSYGPVGIIAPIANAYAIVTAVLGLWLLDATLEFEKMLAILVVITGIGLISYSKPKEGEFKDMRRALSSAFAGLVLFGLGFTLFDRSATQEWYQNMGMYQLANIIVSCGIWLLFLRQGRLKNLRAAVCQPFNIIAGLAGMSGMFALFAALEHVSNAAIPAAIAAAAPLVTAILARIIDKEHLTLIQRLATLIIIAGIGLMSM